MRKLARTISVAVLAALTLSLTASASPAGAAVPIGQTGLPAEGCTAGFDWVQPTVTSGNSYVVPATGGVTAWTLTSWSHDAEPGLPGQMLTMKVFRKVADPATYMAVGHDGPRALTAGVLNTFAGISLPVRSGDVLGFYTVTDVESCAFDAPGDTLNFRQGNLADGESGAFDSLIAFRLNVSAVVTPSNAFTLGALTRNKKKGTATLTVNVPNPGDLTGSGNGVKVVGAAVSAPGDVQLLIKAKGKKKRKLNETGKVKVKPTITYTPTGGDPSSQSIKVKLKKKLKRR